MSPEKKISRRDFLKVAGTVIAGTLVACGPSNPTPQPEVAKTPVPTTVPPTEIPPTPEPKPTVDLTAEAAKKTLLDSNFTDVSGDVLLQGIGGEISGVFGTPKITGPLSGEQITAARAMLGQINSGTLYAVEGGKAVIQRLTGVKDGKDYTNLPDAQVPFKVTVTMLPNTFLQKNGEYDILPAETKPGEVRYIRTNDQKEFNVTSTFLVDPGFLPTGAAFWWDEASMNLQPVIWDGNGNPRLMGNLQVEVAPVLEPTPTPAATVTEVATPINEHELKPAYTEKVSQKYMGVQINAELITDESQDPMIKKVTIPEAVYSEFIARTIFKVWWDKGPTVHPGTGTDSDFNAFMKLWSQAQTSGKQEDWEKVALNLPAVNDLNDGNGYKLKPYTIWPMYSGQAPDGIRGINDMAIALVGRSVDKNVTLVSDEFGLGSNLDNDNLMVYVKLNVIYPDLKYEIASALSEIWTWEAYDHTPSSLDKRMQQMLQNSITVN